MSSKTVVTCDVCKLSEATNTKMQIIFLTEQTEGRPTGAHFVIDELDICPSCLKVALAGNYLFAEGAQGYNRYWFKSAGE
jgi:hypothetical protein